MEEITFIEPCPCCELDIEFTVTLTRLTYDNVIAKSEKLVCPHCGALVQRTYQWQCQPTSEGWTVIDGSGYESLRHYVKGNFPDMSDRFRSHIDRCLVSNDMDVAMAIVDHGYQCIDGEVKKHKEDGYLVEFNPWGISDKDYVYVLEVRTHDEDLANLILWTVRTKQAAMFKYAVDEAMASYGLAGVTVTVLHNNELDDRFEWGDEE